MAAVSVRTYDTIRLPGSKRNTKVLVANTGQTINRERLQILRQQFVTDSGFTGRGTGLFNGGHHIVQPSIAGGSNPYS